MNKRTFWRMGLTLAVLVISIIFLLPTFGFVPKQFSDNLPDSKLSLGLDLVGGIHLTLGVDVAQATDNFLTQTGQSLREVSRDEGVQLTRPSVENGQMQFLLPDGAQQANLARILEENFPQLAYSSQSLPDGSLRYTVRYTNEETARLEENALDRALKIISTRIDRFGVSEPDIRKQSEQKRIIMQLPGQKDTQRTIQIINQAAHLEFRMQYQLSPQEAELAARGILPPGTIALPMADSRGQSRQSSYQPGQSQPTMIVEREASLTGEYVDNAYQMFDSNNQPGVSLSFNSSGAALFERITAENTGRNMAIVLDGKVYSAPVIREKISGGTASITGSFTIEEANDLALVLGSGSLPAKVSVLEERTVGPSLGQESIENGIRAALIGWAAVMIFIIIYYSLSGVIAAAMLLLDVVLLLAGMAAFGATLTLPGIAGIVLTIGMAVDANVLIFERIREELRVGATPTSAVSLGFSRAMLTIMDSNLTTIIATIILYQFGTGPIKGFAVTLSLGIIASMFTAIFVSRTIFDLWITGKTRKISI
ncbi:MAG: protein translocase subunit SecD [Deltaproteobacteria bacterium]|jgi:preprotein translocase subunit SecD|nr:protein translocase subunit SecD [Deltaproteobacteria bacterium]